MLQLNTTCATQNQRSALASAVWQRKASRKHFGFSNYTVRTTAIMNYDLLIELHKGGARQGPGGEQETRLAMTLARLRDQSVKLHIADMGCGTGASTLVLAAELNAEITAVDLFPAFLRILQTRAEQQELADKITPLICSMDELPFAVNSLDAIWAEGAIYNIGFAKGVACLRPFLKQDGILAASEITWLTHERPDEITAYWESEYSEIATAAEKIRVLEESGFSLKGYFPLPEHCWVDNYYEPLESRFDTFLAEHASEEARAIIDAERHEITCYRKYHRYYSYGFYIAQKV
jgi:SAM-dependent methyltransferase